VRTTGILDDMKEPMLRIASRIESYFDRLWPICRSIMGPGFRESLDILSEIMPMERVAFETGEKVLDWTVPEEWIPRDGYLIDPHGNKRADFKKNNLHLLNYSAPFKGQLSLSDLKKHLYSIPGQPEAIPYLTSYYKKQWGICLSQREYEQLPEGEYVVNIDTDFIPGTLMLGESVLPGESEKEIMFSSYLCHPSMANNELSGPLVLVSLYDALRKTRRRRYTYRFVLMPETIGAICFLSQRGIELKERLIAGYQITCIGDRGRFTYKKSRQGNTLADRAAVVWMREQENENIIPFNPAVGSDERQYCSPGFNLPVGSLMRTMYTKYPEYHTSLDNKNLIDFAGMAQAVAGLVSIVAAIEANQHWVNKFPFGEPQLGPRGLFRSLSGKDRKDDEIAMWWLLNLCDGSHDLIAVAERSGLPMGRLAGVAQVLKNAGLLVSGEE